MRTIQEKETVYQQGTEDMINRNSSHKTQKGLLCHDGDIKQELAHSHTKVINHEGQEVAVLATKESEEELGSIVRVESSCLYSNNMDVI